MPRRRYRHVPSAMVGTAASRGYLITKRPYSDMTADYHNECWRRRQASVIVIQPRRYCEIEFSTSTMSNDCLSGPYPNKQTREAIQEASERAIATSKATRKSCELIRDQGVIHGLCLEDATEFAAQLFSLLSNPDAYLLRTPFFPESPDMTGGVA